MIITNEKFVIRLNAFSDSVSVFKIEELQTYQSYSNVKKTFVTKNFASLRILDVLKLGRITSSFYDFSASGFDLSECNKYCSFVFSQDKLPKLLDFLTMNSINFYVRKEKTYYSSYKDRGDIVSYSWQGSEVIMWTDCRETDWYKEAPTFFIL